MTGVQTCALPISGETLIGTGNNYTLTGDEEGLYIRFAVTPIATAGATTGDTVYSPVFGPIHGEPPSSYSVTSNEGNSGVDGTYQLHGFYNGVPYYKHASSEIYIIRTGCEGGWRISTHAYTYRLDNYYAHSSTGDLPPETTDWFPGCEAFTDVDFPVLTPIL